MLQGAAPQAVPADLIKDSDQTKFAKDVLETSRTVRPALSSSRAVPPVERISMLWLASRRASSTRPVLSETDRSARRTGNNMTSTEASGLSLPGRIASTSYARYRD